MLTKVLVHIRRKSVLYLALSFTLGGTWLAASGTPSISGGSKVVSNRVEGSPLVYYPQVTPAGPTYLEIPGFGELFVNQCPDFVVTTSFQNGFRNTSGLVIDAPSVEILDLSTGLGGTDLIQPGQEVSMDRNSSAYAGNGYLLTFQLGAGTGKDQRVATVTTSSLFDTTRNVCRFNAQATIHDARMTGGN